MAAAATKTAAIDGAQLVIHYNFNDPEALWEALQVPGAITSYNTIGRNMANGNKRFALLGDTIGKSALLSKWYQTRASRGSSLTVHFFPSFFVPSSNSSKLVQTD